MYRSPTKHAVGLEVIQLAKKSLADQLLDLSQGRFAGLGGDGAFAELLLEAGAREDHLYLVERKGERNGPLMKRFPKAFHTCGDMKLLDQHFAAHNPPTEGIDLFDWDLNGTIEPVSDDLRPILPLLAKGAGKLLVVTLADCRRNLSLEAPEETRRQASKVFGERASQLLAEHLLSLHAAHQRATNGHADPVNVACRELSALTHLWDSMSQEGLGVDEIHRWIYLSNDFRMRTYVFRLRLEAVHSGMRFVELVQASPCQYVSSDGTKEFFEPYPFVPELACSDLSQPTPNGVPTMNANVTVSTSSTPDADEVLLRRATCLHDPQVREALERKLKLASMAEHLHEYVLGVIAKGMEGFQVAVSSELQRLLSEGPNPGTAAASPTTSATEPVEQAGAGGFVPRTMESLTQNARETERAWLKTAEIRLRLLPAQRERRLDEEIAKIAQEQSRACDAHFKGSMKSVLARGRGEWMGESMAHYLVSPSVTSQEEFVERARKLGSAYGTPSVDVLKKAKESEYWLKYHDWRHSAWVKAVS